MNEGNNESSEDKQREQQWLTQDVQGSGRNWYESKYYRTESCDYRDRDFDLEEWPQNVATYRSQQQRCNPRHGNQEQVTEVELKKRESAKALRLRLALLRDASIQNYIEKRRHVVGRIAHKDRIAKHNAKVSQRTDRRKFKFEVNPTIPSVADMPSLPGKRNLGGSAIKGQFHTQQNAVEISQIGSSNVLHVHDDRHDAISDSSQDLRRKNNMEADKPWMDEDNINQCEEANEIDTAVIERIKDLRCKYDLMCNSLLDSLHREQKLKHALTLRKELESKENIEQSKRMTEKRAESISVLVETAEISNEIGNDKHKAMASKTKKFEAEKSTDEDDEYDAISISAAVTIQSAIRAQFGRLQEIEVRALRAMQQKNLMETSAIRIQRSIRRCIAYLKMIKQRQVIRMVKEDSAVLVMQNFARKRMAISIVAKLRVERAAALAAEEAFKQNTAATVLSSFSRQHLGLRFL